MTFSHSHIFDILERRTPGDGTEAVKDAILDVKRRGVDLILCTGGMSVDLPNPQLG